MKKWMYLGFVMIVGGGLIMQCDEDDGMWGWVVPEADDEPTKSEIEGFVYKPALMPATDENVVQLEVPEGFTVQKFAENTGNPRMIAVNDDGVIYFSDREAGEVKLLEDTDVDGQSDRMEVVATIESAHGLAIYEDKLYIVAVREVYSADIQEDGTLAEPQMLTDELPDGGQHPNRTIAFGPDSKMYISVGSTCNSCDETNPLNATMVQANLDATDMKIFAKGLRNTIGFDWHPESGELWGMDHGIDWLGDEEQKEELNKLMAGEDYGWPYIYGAGNYNPGDRPAGDTTYQQYLEKTTLPVLTLLLMQHLWVCCFIGVISSLRNTEEMHLWCIEDHGTAAIRLAIK